MCAVDWTVSWIGLKFMTAWHPTLQVVVLALHIVKHTVALKLKCLSAHRWTSIQNAPRPLTLDRGRWTWQDPDLAEDGTWEASGSHWPWLLARVISICTSTRHWQMMSSFCLLRDPQNNWKDCSLFDSHAYSLVIIHIIRIVHTGIGYLPDSHCVLGWK